MQRTVNGSLSPHTLAELMVGDGPNFDGERTQHTSWDIQTLTLRFSLRAALGGRAARVA